MRKKEERKKEKERKKKEKRRKKKKERRKKNIPTSQRYEEPILQAPNFLHTGKKQFKNNQIYHFFFSTYRCRRPIVAGIAVLCQWIEK
jgi:hypothetical protein